MHAILVTAGTDGDVHPFVGVGVRLRARGHRVTLVTSENYRGLASEQGLGFQALLTKEEMDGLLDDPDVWHPFKSGLIAARWGVRGIRKQFELLKELAGSEDTMLVAYPPIFGARLVQETRSRPLVSLVVMPWMVPSVFQPVLAGIPRFPGWMPSWGARCYWRLLHAVGDLLVGRHVNRIRRSLGLRPIKQVFDWWFSPQRVIGMFPEWFAPPRAARLPQMRLAGFPLFDRKAKDGLPDGLLAFCKAGPPPVALTFGTGNKHAARQIRIAIEACGIVGARALLLTKFRDQVPAPLPPSAFHCHYAPFTQLFPHCAAVVHHGGFGTTAQALAAGKPQLILPMAFDQPDNAARVKQLGAGESLKPSSSGAQIAQALARLMTDPVQARCRELAARFRGEDPFDTTAQWIEELAPKR